MISVLTSGLGGPGSSPRGKGRGGGGANRSLFSFCSPLE